MTSAIITVRGHVGDSTQFIRLARAKDLAIHAAFQRDVLLYHPRDLSPSGFYAVGRLIDFCPDPDSPHFMYVAVTNIRHFPQAVSARKYLRATGQTVDHRRSFPQFSPGFRLVPRAHAILVEGLARLPADLDEARLEITLPLEAEQVSVLDLWPEGLPLTATPNQIADRRRRDAKLRLDTLDVYGPRCAASNMSIMAPNGIQSEVEVCHLWAFGAGGPDSINNAMPMMRSIHWCFDNGWFGIRRNGNLCLVPHAPNFLQTILKNRPSANFPSQPQRWPHPDCLQWHWDNRFRKTLRQLGLADQIFD